VQLRPDDPAPPTLSLVAGLTLLEAIDVAVPGQALQLKWPNDVMLAGRKLAGILLERSGDRVAVGFGVNLASAPALPDRPSASLSGQVLPQAFAPLLAGCFSRLLDAWRNGEPTVLVQAWLARAHPRGSEMTVHSSPTDTINGRFDGIEPDGALRLCRNDGSVEIVRAGDVSIG
jgi:BirA family biotin operon repressor/biotin-[acetyl-CoA-carboxylase] ligase